MAIQSSIAHAGRCARRSSAVPTGAREPVQSWQACSDRQTPWLAPRSACGFALTNKGHDTRALQAYLGHKNIQHIVGYTELAADRFKDFWR
ncbi:tyrosine-type recombinase/integrase [Bradyrhizobium jicamae]|uniref:tyrosine-type recombinase/integrase n=1 Tax=Bradyrhizobium jicamae TaxID=280332 RepID=UPI0039084222